jgi:hypothetical protein
MEEKKALLLNILRKLEWTWDLAENMIALIESEYCSGELLDSLIGLINAWLKNIADKSQNIEMANALAEIEKMKLSQENI